MGVIPIPTVIVWMREDILFMRNYLSPERAFFLCRNLGGYYES
ncbi:hypothetical protein ANHYDRO_00484 [Anaerococcus hydrogenalis DSM 7454]|uniref:Uncharacterized protein n=1 Tax=Anaerococcus hydrogenalis DSM 7454 TaxID=561177 RepID=B6W7D8_9FIRM|nr:hypothetical protein ANHYDRO_00484 [Anaerococcus hydrogenalis DSM 7454]